MNKQCEELKLFWEEITKKSVVTLPDLDKLKELLAKVFQKQQELEVSRDLWREKFELKGSSK